MPRGRRTGPCPVSRQDPTAGQLSRPGQDRPHTLLPRGPGLARPGPSIECGRRAGLSVADAQRLCTWLQARPRLGRGRCLLPRRSPPSRTARALSSDGGKGDCWAQSGTLNPRDGAGCTAAPRIRRGAQQHGQGMARMTQDEGGQARVVEQCGRQPSPGARPRAATRLPSRQHSSSSDSEAFLVCSFPPSSELCACVFRDVTVPGKKKH